MKAEVCVEVLDFGDHQTLEHVANVIKDCRVVLAADSACRRQGGNNECIRCLNYLWYDDR